MRNPMQAATAAVTPAELLKGFNTLDTMRQDELLAYLEELRAEMRATERATGAVTA